MHIHVYMYVIVPRYIHVALLHRNQHNINKESQKKLNVWCLRSQASSKAGRHKNNSSAVRKGKPTGNYTAAAAEAEAAVALTSSRGGGRIWLQQPLSVHWENRAHYLALSAVAYAVDRDGTCSALSGWNRTHAVSLRHTAHSLLVSLPRARQHVSLVPLAGHTLASASSDQFVFKRE